MIERIESTQRMSRIVKHAGTVYLCGQTAADAGMDVKKQTQACLDKIEALLEKAGSDCNKLLSVTIYLSDMQHFAPMNEVWDAWIKDYEKPARACVEARLARPQVLVEFTVTAAYE